MRLEKLKFLSITCVCMAVFTVVSSHFTDRHMDSGSVYFVIVLCLMTSAIELIRLELRDLRREREEADKPDTAATEADHRNG